MGPVTRKLINPPGLHPTPGLSHTAVHESRGIAGQAALAYDFSILGKDDLAGQTRVAMEHIGVTLDAIRGNVDRRDAP